MGKAEKLKLGQVVELRRRIGVGNSVAIELLTLAGGDIDLAEKGSKMSQGLDQAKAAILNERISRIETAIK